MQDELDALWQRRSSAIVDSVGSRTDSEVEAAIRHEEANLMVLKSRESVLREEIAAIGPASAIRSWPRASPWRLLRRAAPREPLRGPPRSRGGPTGTGSVQCSTRSNAGSRRTKPCGRK